MTPFPLLAGPLRSLALAVLFLGLLLASWLGTSLNSLLFWPAVVVLGLSGVLTAATLLLQGSSRLSFLPLSCVGAVVVTVFYLGLRAALSPVSYAARPDLFLLGTVLIVYLSTVTLLSSDRALKFLLIFLLIVFGGHLAGFVISSTVNPDFHLVPGFSGGQFQDRATALFTAPNHFAAWLDLFVFLLLGAAVNGRLATGWKIVLLAGGALGIVLVIMTKSRAGVAATGIGMAIFLLLSMIRSLVWQNPRRAILVAAAGLAILALVISFALPRVISLLETRVPGLSLIDGISRDQYRESLRDVAIEQWKTSPAFGTGAGSFRRFFRQERPPSYPLHSGIAFYAHAEYHQALAEYGLVGLSVIGICAALHFWTGVRRTLPSSRDLSDEEPTALRRGIVIGALAGLGANLFHAYFDLHFHIPATALLAALCLGILAVPQRTRSSSAAFPSKWMAAALLFCSGTGILLASIKFAGNDLLFHRSRQIAPNDRAERQKLLDQITGKDPQNTRGLYFSASNLAMTAFGLAESSAKEAYLDAALNDSMRCRQLDPAHVENLLLLGKIHDTRGNYQLAEEAFLEAARRAPRDGKVRLAMGIHYHTWGQWDDAWRQYHYAIGPFLAMDTSQELIRLWITRMLNDRDLIEKGGAP